MEHTPPKSSSLATFKKLVALLGPDKRQLLLAFSTILLASALNLAAPYVFGRAVDLFVRQGNSRGIFLYAGILLVLYAIAFVCQYVQMRLMGGVGQSVLFRLRNRVFTKLQGLPIAFFNRHKAGDLISRINNDTDKLNQFFSETLVRFMGGIFSILGAAVFLLVINFRLGMAALVPALILLVFTQFISGWVKRRTAESLKHVGGLSAEVQESLDNFKVIVAFNRRDYFRTRFQAANVSNFQAAVKAGRSSGLFSPMYDAASTLAQLIIIGYGIFLISNNLLTLGLLISFLLYAERFYMPLRQIATFWSSLQLALAAWDRVSDVLNEPEPTRLPSTESAERVPAVLEFRDVHFRYDEQSVVLRKANFTLLPGKTYALVGPTGGGKTTTASLMVGLYDPTEGSVLFHGRDVRSYDPEERAQKIGFILQEPFLFTGTILENIFFGNTVYRSSNSEERVKALEEAGLGALLTRFDQGLETPVSLQGTTMSLGQRQLIAFMRAVMRKPEILILDEATANIDTVTEKMLQETLDRLPSTTAKVIIAHRLNTIENADEIFFVNGGEVASAGSFTHAIDLLMHGKRQT